MVMPKALSKVQKHITRKKGARAQTLHANSRDAQMVLRAGARDQKLAKTVQLRARLNAHYGKFYL